MKANWVVAVTFTLMLSILAACTAPPAAPAAPPPAPTATPVPPTPASELMDVVKAYEAAVNRDDASGIPALFPEQFNNDWMKWYRSIMTNQKELANSYAFEAAMHDGTKFEDCRPSLDKWVTCSVTYWDDCWKAAGVPAVKLFVDFTIIDKKIKTLSTRPSESTPADYMKFDQRMTDLAQWIRQERQDQRAKLYDDQDGYILSAESGAIWSQLCQEYAATLK